VTPDLVSTNPQGGTTAYDVVVVGVTHKDGFNPLSTPMPIWALRKPLSFL